MVYKVTPWRRKPKIKDLQEGITTALSFAVIGSPEKFSKNHHGYRVYKLLKELGAEVYPVAVELEKLEKDKVFPNLLSLPRTVDVVIPCLPEAFTLSIVQEAKEVGTNKIWFQQKTLSQDAWQFCQDQGLEIIEGCTLMYKNFGNLLKHFDPCFWHAKTFARKQK